MSILPLLLFVLPSGLDTLGVSISLGIKSQRNERSWRFPTWLQSAILFSLAETLMPLAGPDIGLVFTCGISAFIGFVCPFLLINVCFSDYFCDGQTNIQ